MKKLITLFLVLTATVAMTFAQESLKVVTPLFLATDVPEEEVSVITDYFISKYAFAVKGKAEVIDRDSFDMLVEEHNFQSNDWASKEGRSQLEMLNASHLVRGKLSKFRSQLVVTIKLIDVKTGVVYATYEDRIKDVEELFDKMPEICEKLAEQIGGISIKKDEPVKESDSMTAINTNNTSKVENTNTTSSETTKNEISNNTTPKYKVGDAGLKGGTIFAVVKAGTDTLPKWQYYEFIEMEDKGTYTLGREVLKVPYEKYPSEGFEWNNLYKYLKHPNDYYWLASDKYEVAKVAKPSKPNDIKTKSQFSKYRRVFVFWFQR